MPTALITGVFGQDGFYLTQYLLAQGYAVVGLDRRREDEFVCDFSDAWCRRFDSHTIDLVSGEGLEELVAETRPDEVYHLAAQSNPTASFEDPVGTLEINGLGIVRLLEAVRRHAPEAHVFNAATADLFGSPDQSPQNESTPFSPLSPYACSKLYAYHQVRVHRGKWGLHASNGILFNHESPRRSEEFVTRKITRGAVRIKAGLQDTLALGNLDSVRDWGFAGDTVRAMHAMLAKDRPGDFVIGTGQGRTVRQFVECAFGLLDLSWQDHVKIDQAFFRPTEPHPRIADPAKARKELTWEPEVSFNDLVARMVAADAEREGLEL